MFIDIRCPSNKHRLLFFECFTSQLEICTKYGENLNKGFFCKMYLMP